MESSALELPAYSSAVARLSKRPFIIIFTVVILYLLGSLMAAVHPTVSELPIPHQNGWPVFIVFQLLHLQDFLSGPIALRLALRLPMLLFFLICGITILVARRWPQWRNLATVIAGVLWLQTCVSWPYLVCVSLVIAIVHFGFRKINSHLSMLLTFGMLLVCFKMAPFGSAAMTLMALGGMRVLMYAFEVSSIPPNSRSFLSAMAYSPVGIFLSPGEPPMTSYLGYTSPVAQQSLDEKGSLQLLRSALKYLILVFLFWVLLPMLPARTSLSEASIGLRMIAFAAPMIVLFLRLSIVSDMACGLSCLAGYHAIDGFHYPLLAENPIDFWIHWQIPMLSFIRRAFIFPIAKYRRSLALAIAAGMLGAMYFHCANALLSVGEALTWEKTGNILLNQGSHYAATGLLIVLGIPFYKNRKSRKPIVRLLFLVLTQLAMMWTFSGMFDTLINPTVTGTTPPISVVLFGR